MSFETDAHIGSIKRHLESLKTMINALQNDLRSYSQLHANQAREIIRLQSLVAKLKLTQTDECHASSYNQGREAAFTAMKAVMADRMIDYMTEVEQRCLPLAVDTPANSEALERETDEEA